MNNKHLLESIRKKIQKELFTNNLKEACWKGYVQLGMKKLNGRNVPNCVKKSNEEVEAPESQVDITFDSGLNQWVATDIMSNIIGVGPTKEKALEDLNNKYNDDVAKELLNDPHHVEKYKIDLGLAEDKEQIPGGSSKKKTTPSIEELADKYNVGVGEVKAKVATGEKIEMEHTTDSDVAKEIARDHLGEDFFYYEKLKKIEKK